MPLFMDYHKGLAVTIEEVKQAHIADEAVQSKYGVIYHQFWVNEQDGTVFCLMEGPDKDSCEAVHREAHGEVACSIVEVETGFYELLMGRGQVVEQGVVKHKDGTIDPGIRCMIAVNIQGITTIHNSAEYQSLKPPVKAKELALSLVSERGGRLVNWLPDDTLIAVFDSTRQAVNCALQMQSEFVARRNSRGNDEWNFTFRVGLVAGQPVTEDGELFSEAITLARRLSTISNANEILISSRVKEYCDVGEVIDRAENAVRILTPREEEFISRLFAVSEENLSDECFSIDSLSKGIGISRPQLYRKIVSLTGKSPNDFVRDLRMDRALALIKRKAGNISEIALEVGYSNPSYFARCFQMRFGCTPSRFMAEAA